MKTFYKVLIVALVPIVASIIAATVAKALDGDPKYYGGMYLGMAYMMCLYEVGFIRKGFNV